MAHRDFDHFYARVAPMFWPVLWLSIQALCRWHARYGEPDMLLDLTVTWWGRIRITRIYRAGAPELVTLHAFKDCTEDWHLDWLGTWSAQFARLNDVGCWAVGALVCTLANLFGFAPRPAINDSS